MNKPADNTLREDIQIIYDMILPNSTVLDLGCGDGTLLKKLMDEKGVKAQGVEKDANSIYLCIEKGVPVIQADLDLGLQDFPPNSYDYVILSQTMQLLNNPQELIKEMLTIGKIGIVSIVNFGFWQYRINLLRYGRLSLSSVNEPLFNKNINIKLLTLNDFLQFIAALNLTICDSVYLQNPRFCKKFKWFPPSLFCQYAVFKLTRTAAENL